MSGVLSRGEGEEDSPCVVELGAGTGALGLILSTMFSRVIVTDTETFVPQIRQNIATCGMDDTTTVQELSWGRDSLPDGCRVVVGSDII
jgi:methylase of polypeptide subunit release factors